MAMIAPSGQPDTQDSAAAAVLFSEFGHALDTKDWQAYAALYGPDGSLALPGGSPVPQSRLEAICEAVLGRFQETHHMITNVLSTRQGAENHVTANLRAAHFYPDDSHEPWVVYGRYTATTYLRGKSLVFKDVELEILWQTGDQPPAPR